MLDASHVQDTMGVELGELPDSLTRRVPLERARTAAGVKDIRIGGGADTIRQYLKARLIDEMHLAVSPTLLGVGEHLLADIDLSTLGYTCTKWVASAKAAHYTIAKS